MLRDPAAKFPGTDANAQLIAALVDQTRAIDELVRVNDELLAELRAERELAGGNDERSETYLNGKPRA